MAVDLAMDFVAGDLMIGPSNDIDRATGTTLIDQRIRVRLLIVQGEWTLDPSGGSLGSRLREALRLPLFRAEQEVPMLAQEALDPMNDITVTNVTAAPVDDDSSALALTVFYQVIDDVEQTDPQLLSTTVTIQG
jgi:hypothetical protein